MTPSGGGWDKVTPGTWARATWGRREGGGEAYNGRKKSEAVTAK